MRDHILRSSGGKIGSKGKGPTEEARGEYACLKTFTVSLFKAFDENNDGTIDKTEFVKGLLKLSPPIRPSKEEIDLVFPVFDINNDGSLSYKEFATIIQADDGAYSKMPIYRSHHTMQLAMETTTMMQRLQRIKSKTASLPSLDNRPKASPVKVYHNIGKTNTVDPSKSAVKRSSFALYRKIEKTRR